MAIATGGVLSHYRLVEKLGEGGMGVVWRARDLKLERDVAIKLLSPRFANDPERRANLEREAKAIAALNHPNIVTIHSFEESEGERFFVMEYVEGESLSKRIALGGMTLDRFLKLALPLADAIAAAHERGIIHRDLKPGNVVVGAGGSVKVLDFGLARYLAPASPLPSEDDTTADAAMTRGLSGTIRYMSPEQLRGESIDHRSDHFSLGVILFEIATGELPFGGDTAADAVASILKDEPRSVAVLNPRLPRELDRVLAHCLEKDARHRIQSAVDLRHELQGLVREGSPLEPKRDASIAVLPFADMSPEKDQAYFCDGMAEEIINALSKLQGLRVASRTSSFQLRDARADSREIGRRLDVLTLLEGSVRKAGSRLRIIVQLIEAGSGFHLWSERFDREMKDVFEIQEEIARNVVRALKVTLSPQERGALGKAPTLHVQAYDYYLRGRNYYYRYGRRDIEFALQLFSRAVELDPGYALAHAGLADCWSYIYLYSERKDEVRDQAENASRRAVELAPDSAQSHASRGAALHLAGHDDEAEREFETAIKLDPDLFEAWYFYARKCFVSGELERAVSLYEQAMRVRPEDYQSPLLAAQIYDDLGRPEEARAARRRGVALVEARLEMHPDDARALYMGANGRVALGEREAGLEWARRARELAPEEAMLLYNLGCIYSLAGEVDEALDCLEAAVNHGVTQKGWYEHDSNLDPLRRHPRFIALLDGLS